MASNFPTESAAVSPEAVAQKPKAACVQALSELKAGQFLGRYELLMPVATGGMAAVWAARLVGTRGFQKVVAIKTMLPSLSEDARFEQMFLDEAALAARIRHPNVVQVLDLGDQDGLLYQAMEWIDGEPLNVFLRTAKTQGCIPFAIAARILIGACEGLHAAHETRDDNGNCVGLVHRDVSPQNILVTRDGVPKVVDFGVAKLGSLARAQTAVGMLKGKPAYMAPEQVRGEEVDRRADVFSLGVLLYILTTGVDPFRGPTDIATLHNVVSPAPAQLPRSHQPHYPTALQDVVMTALDKRLENRFPTAAAMARALEAAVPEVREVGDAEVAAFMRERLGKKLDKRDAALKQALHAADVRSTRPEATQFLGSPSILRATGTLPPVSLCTRTQTAASLSLAPNVTTLASECTASPLQPRKRGTSRTKLAALGLAPLLLVAATAAVLFLALHAPDVRQDGGVGHGAAVAAGPAVEQPAAERPAPAAEAVASAELPAEAPDSAEVPAEAPDSAEVPAEAPDGAESEEKPAAKKPPRAWPRRVPLARRSAPPPSHATSNPPAPSPDETAVRGTVPTISDPGF